LRVTRESIDARYFHLEIGARKPRLPKLRATSSPERAMRLLPAEPRLPIALKIAFTAFMAVMVRFYWRTYGPTNFLYFCDVAMFMTLAAVWTEKPPARRDARGGHRAAADALVSRLRRHGGRQAVVGMTAYMFDEGIPRFARGISLFHAWLPFLLLYLVRKLGYDRRALVAWTVLAWSLIGISYLFIPAPPRSRRRRTPR
jgi:hypothetical protein